MNWSSLALAALAATVVYFLYGGIVFGALPLLRNEYARYPAVYRKQDEMRAVMPIGIAAMFVSILVLAYLYSVLYPGGSGAAQGARFGALIGIFAVCAFVIHNHVNLKIGWKLTLGQAAAYWIEWTIVGIVIGLTYRPGPTP